MTALVLASGSRYRATQLRQLGQAFTQQAADIDETPFADETPRETAMRLALAKARHVAADHRQALVIGSDQVAECDGKPIGKPGSMERARRQLQQASGREVRFFTALCLIGTNHGSTQQHLDTTVVHFRQLEDDEIARYLAAEKPLDCAGSFKCEGLGISLFEAIETHDPSALIGLPLITLAKMLREAGLALP